MSSLHQTDHFLSVTPFDFLRILPPGPVVYCGNDQEHDTAYNAMVPVKNHDMFFCNSSITPSAARPAMAPNPGVFLVPGGSAAVVTGNAGDVAGKETVGLAAVSIAVAGMVGGMKNRNNVDDPMEPPVPWALVIEIGNVPGEDGGVTIVRLRSLRTVRLVPDFPPNRTSLAPLNPDPESMTRVPPSMGPEAGKILVSFGTGISYRNMVADASDLPVQAGLMTDMATVPSGPGGAMIVRWLSSGMVRSVPDIPPNRTSVAPENPEPVMLTP